MRRRIIVSMDIFFIVWLWTILILLYSCTAFPCYRRSSSSSRLVLPPAGPFLVELNPSILTISRCHGRRRHQQQQQQQQQRDGVVMSMGLFRGWFNNNNKKGEEKDTAADDRDDENNDNNNDNFLSENMGNIVTEEEIEAATTTPFFVDQYLTTLQDTTTATTNDDDADNDAAAADNEKNVHVNPQPISNQNEVVELLQQQQQQQLSSSLSSSPLAQAQSLRAQAARIRLEAEKRQVELTLEKIAKLENKLELFQKKKDKENLIDNNKNKDDNEITKYQQSLEEELLRLKSSMLSKEDEEQIKTLLSSSTTTTTTTSSSPSSSQSDDSILPNNNNNSQSSDLLVLQERIQQFQKAPEFMQSLIAKMITNSTGYENVTNNNNDIHPQQEDFNVTNIVQQIIHDEKKKKMKMNDDEKRRRDEEFSIVGKKSVSSSFDFPNNRMEERTAREMLERAYNQKSAGSKDEEEDTENTDMPIFTKEQIDAKLKELEDIPQFLKNMVVMNETELATMLLEDEWMDKKKKRMETSSSRGGGRGFFGLFNGGRSDNEKGDFGRDGERLDLSGTRGAFSRMFSNEEEDDSSSNNNNNPSLLNNNGTSNTNIYGQPTQPLPPGSELDFMMNSLYPQSTRKEGQTPEKRLVNSFLNDIVAPTKVFTPSDNPIPVNGGWIIRGKNTGTSGDELIEKLDRRIANDGRLRGKISFFLLKDPFPNPEEQQELMLDPLNWPQVLFVAGPDVARDSAPIVRTIISAFGIATTWYGSIYPFLANPKLMDRATEAMALADAGMPTDLSWLSEMSIPLFLSFMTLQLIHEIAHQLVARSRGFEATIPTLVPSILSGITSSITSLKSSPKNKQDLVDFAVAGPLTGMIGSILVLCYGLVLTATADTSMVQSFPGIPLVLLRQSSLGGGLIDIFLGNGVLNVPASAEGAQALASTLIALHPFAVAGFFSLIVNALALVPAGRTDGGRISMALFGRSGCQAVTFASLASLFVLGITQSDLLLFYFAFLIFFQSELEIPMRNEVDDVDFSRVLLTSFAGFLMLLTLIPM